MKSKFARIILALLICMFVRDVSIAQCDCDTDINVLPEMWVEKTASIERTNEFITSRTLNPSKFTRLLQVNGSQTTSFFISKKSFKTILDTLKNQKILRIYFAKYVVPTVPKEIKLKNKQLTLIFAVGTGEADVGKFILDNEGTFHPINDDNAKIWIDNYKRDDLKELNKTIDKSDPDNHPENGDSEDFSDTKYIFYEQKDINEAFNKEVAYQKDKNHIIITGYLLTFSAYTKEGNQVNNSDHQYKKRFIIQFEYTTKINGENKVYYIDDQADFECRLCITKQKYMEKFDEAKALDNGHLCPANCPVKQ